MGNTVSPKRKYTLLWSRVLKPEEGQMESMGCATHSNELVQTGPSLILELKEMAHPLLCLYSPGLLSTCL